MPLYDYKCEKCGHSQEHRMGMSEPKPDCPVCKEKERYVKQVSAAQFHLKGNGWYKTDFKNK